MAIYTVLRNMEELLEAARYSRSRLTEHSLPFIPLPLVMTEVIRSTSGWSKAVTENSMARQPTEEPMVGRAAPYLASPNREYLPPSTHSCPMAQMAMVLFLSPE